MQLSNLKRNVSATSSQTITVISSSQQNAFEQNLIRKHLRALTKGTSSKYQMQLLVIQCMIWIQITFISMIGAFVFMNPMFLCKGVERSEDEACKIKKCKFLNKFTATYTHGLYCEGQDDRVIIQSMFPAGCLVGMFLLPWISDKYGRRFAMLLGLGLELFGIVILLIGLYQDSVTFICLGLFLLGIFASGCSVITYVISSQISTGKLRQSAIMLFNGVWGIGLMSFYFIYNYVPEWHNFLVYLIFFPSLFITCAVYFTLMETPDYLLIIEGSLNDYVDMMKRMALINKSIPGKYRKVFGKRGKYNIFTIFQDKQEAIRSYSSNKKIKNPNQYVPVEIKNINQTEKQKKIKKNTFQLIFNDNKTLKIILCIGLSLIGYNIFYFGMQASMERSKNSYGVTMLIAGAHEFIGFFLSGIFIQKIKRKSGLIIVNLLASLAGLCFMVPFVEKSSLIQTLLISFSTLMTVFSFSLSSTLQTQSFPSTIKSTAIGITSGFSQMGRIAVPFLLNFTNKLSIHPFFASSILYILLGTIPLFFVTQTFTQQENDDDEQQDNVEQSGENDVGDKQLLDSVSLSRSVSTQLRESRFFKGLKNSFSRKEDQNMYLTPQKRD